uniref:Ig-like domain-containing protein n=1 Tax=Oreochromis niloticus TaxID=8128 RepID=A0A669BX39_ORENI
MQLMLLLLLLASQHASAVVVYEGVESVRLPCHVPADVALESTAAVWDREDLNIQIVHVRLRSSDDFKEQSIRYTNRTSMRADALQTGDLSLTLKNPTVSDSGTYKCTVRKYGRDQSKTYVDLKVTVRPPPVWPIVLFALLVPVVLLAAAFGVFMYPRYKMLKMRKDYPVEMVEVEQEEKSVLLPFKVTEEDDISQDVKVEWKRQNMIVHVYQNNEHQHLLQDQDYRDRTEMNEDPHRTKDFSLKLKDLQLSDHGGYTCTVYNKDGYILLQKVVLLNITVLQVEMVEVTQGEKSVLLPFRIKDDLSLDVTLLWRHEKVTVHAYQRGQNQSVLIGQDYEGRTEMKKDPLNNKDFSLTLKDLRLTDRGVYTCTVHNKDGHMLLQKAVTLSVREYQLEMVEVTQGKEFVLLPFKIKEGFTQDVKVEWKHKNKMVHEYQIGKDQCHLKDQDQKQRTEMKKDPLNTKDLSLTLKDLHLTDSGVYTCTVYNKDGHMLIQKSVTLSVRGECYSCLSTVQNRYRFISNKTEFRD